MLDYKFKAITLQDKGIFDRYFGINKFPNSEYNFTTLYAWENMNNNKYCIIEDCLVMFARLKEKDFCYFPVGAKENVKKCLPILDEIFKAKNAAFTMPSPSRPMLDFMTEFDMLKNFSIEPMREYYDYLVPRVNITELAGKKLRNKRNHFNYFVKNNQAYLREIDAENEEACGILLTELIIDRSVDVEDELTATARVLKDRIELNLTARAMYIDEILAGVIMAEIHHDVVLIQIAKTNIDFRGASVMMFKLFLEECFTEYEQTNLMEDMGLEGLRRSKEAYDPEGFVEKFFLKKELGLNL